MIAPLVFLTLLVSAPAIAGVPIRILPEHILLEGPDAIQHVLVARVDPDDPSVLGPTVPDTLAKVVSRDPSIVIYEKGMLVPRGNGSTEVDVHVDDQVVASCRVLVTDYESPTEWSFRNDIQSVLSRQGCNMGACHGALAGKGGFRLSLLGYDSESDFFTIAHEARGRRIEIADPGRSLLLAKPTGALPHKGGLRLDTQSRDYRVLSQWVANGAQAPAEDDARLVAIQVTPAQSKLTVGDVTRILVTAQYDDGRQVDVTHWAKFSSTDEAIAGVDASGQVTIRGCGEGAVLVWFGSNVRLARLRVPYPNAIDAQTFVDAPRRNFIDELNLQQLANLHLIPSPRCDDHVFLRRVTIDTVGRLPTEQEVSAFDESLAASDVRAARDEVIERLLSSEDFVDYWSYRFSDILLINGNKLRPAAVKAYYAWLRDCIARSVPWDEMVREILTATGVSTENGATNFYALHQTPEDMTENACQAFLGLSIGCARCHNHPLEKWTNDQYYSMANLFARVRAKGWGGETRNGDGIRTLYVTTLGDLVQPSTGRPQPPAPLDGEPLAFDDPSDRRVPLADWMTDPTNPYFARAITNRIWANFFSRGLVEQVDDLRLSNPASNEPLLASMADYLIDANFDLRSLMRVILQSETYQRSSLPLSENREENKYHSRYYPRRMMAEVLLDSIDQTLETSTVFDQVAFSGADKQKTDFYPSGTRAIELFDSAVESYFLKTFGRNPREIVCDCERSAEPSMVQVLHLSNGSTLNPKLADKNGLIARRIHAGDSDRDILETVFMRALTREPTESEWETMQAVMTEYDSDRATALQDAAWSVLSSAEFSFNH
ncbi:MAG: DUF1549 and DUF1553 domain-containing protein [Planctomycetota bacterium]